MKTSRYDSQRADGTNKWDDCPWLKVCPSEATRGADGSRPPTSAAIGGRDLGARAATAERGERILLSRDSRTCEHPAWRSSLTVVPLDGHVLDGRERRPSDANCATGIRPDRAWPGSGRPACERRVNVARRRPPVWRRRTARRPPCRPRRGPHALGRAGSARSTSAQRREGPRPSHA